MSTKKIFEELPSRKYAPAAAPQKAEATGGEKKGPESEEKRIRQAVYDIRYRARREEIPLAQAFSQYMQNAKLGGAEQAAVRKKLFEEYVISDMTSDGIAAAMFKVFVEGVEEEEDPAEIYLKEFRDEGNKYTQPKTNESPAHKKIKASGFSGTIKQTKYKVKVVDKSGRSYVRYATREKINKLRLNPNIQSVEMTEYGEPYEGEKKKGKQTAAALAGKDYDGDGKIESSAKEHAGVVHNAIQRTRGLKPDGKDTSNVREELVGNQSRIDANHNNKIDADDFKILRAKKKKKVNEEFIDEKIRPTTSQNEKKITGKGVNNSKLITVYPTLSSQAGQIGEEVIDEKAVSTAQQKFFGMVHAYKKGKMKGASKEVKKAAASINDTEAEKFASTKHKGLPGHVKKSVKKESVELDEAGMPIIVVRKKSSDKSEPCMTSDLKKINPDDPRGQYAKDAKVKNTLHSMGAKNVMMVGEKKDDSYLETDMKKRQANNEKSIADMKKTKGYTDMVKTVRKQFDEENEETLDELTRYAKETGKSFRTGKPTSTGGKYAGSDVNSQAMRSVLKSMGAGRAGVAGRGVKKEKGAPTPGPTITPAQKVAKRRDAAQKAQDMMHSRFD